MRIKHVIMGFVLSSASVSALADVDVDCANKLAANGIDLNTVTECRDSGIVDFRNLRKLIYDTATQKN